MHRAVLPGNVHAVRTDQPVSDDFFLCFFIALQGLGRWLGPWTRSCLLRKPKRWGRWLRTASTGRLLWLWPSSSLTSRRPSERLGRTSCSPWCACWASYSRIFAFRKQKARHRPKSKLCSAQKSRCWKLKWEVWWFDSLQKFRAHFFFQTFGGKLRARTVKSFALGPSQAPYTLSPWYKYILYTETHPPQSYRTVLGFRRSQE